MGVIIIAIMKLIKINALFIELEHKKETLKWAQQTLALVNTTHFPK